MTYVRTHSPTPPSLYLRQSSFFNASVALPTSQLVLQSFFRFSYVTGSSLNGTSRAAHGILDDDDDGDDGALYFQSVQYIVVGPILVKS